MSQRPDTAPRTMPRPGKGPIHQPGSHDNADPAIGDDSAIGGDSAIGDDSAIVGDDEPGEEWPGGEWPGGDSAGPSCP